MFDVFPEERTERDEFDGAIQEDTAGRVGLLGREGSADLFGTVFGEDRLDNCFCVGGPCVDEVLEQAAGERVLGDEHP